MKNAIFILITMVMPGKLKTVIDIELAFFAQFYPLDT